MNIPKPMQVENRMEDQGGLKCKKANSYKNYQTKFQISRCTGSAPPKPSFSTKFTKDFQNLCRKIYPHVFSIFVLKKASLGKIGFRGYNPEVQTLLQTPILITWINYGVYGNYGHIAIMAIVGIWPQMPQTPQLTNAIDIGVY